MTLTYLLPLRIERSPLQPDGEMVRYLRGLIAHVDEILVVDGSPPRVFDAHAVLFAGLATHVAPDERDRCLNGKAWAALTGLRRARHDTVVIADDDVRWNAATLARATAVLETCDLVLPANYFAPMVWHAAWDTGRILLNRAIAHDWPGTVLLRRSALGAGAHYDGDVLFENCELVRTVIAAGGRVQLAPGLLVARRPPTLRHFVAQRPRQAYDDLAQPLRMTAMLAVLPAGLVGGRRVVAGGALLSVAAAEIGRRRDGGTTAFPWYSTLLAPAWLLERGALAWWAVWLRVSGRGITYSGNRLLRAATPLGQLRARRRLT